MTANSRGLIYDLNVTEIRPIVLTHDMTANSRGLIYDLNVTEIRSIVLTNLKWQLTLLA